MSRNTLRPPRAAWLLAAAALAVCQVPAAAQPRPARPAGKKPPRVELKVGQRAPEFELVPLVFKTDEKGRTVGTIGTRKVRLSDFRGKAPVCIFSSSYT